MSLEDALIQLAGSIGRLFSLISFELRYSSAAFRFVLACIVGLLYFFPYVVAIWRGHRNKMPIFLTNLFFGWTAIGWIVALIWATTANTASPAPDTRGR